MRQRTEGPQPRRDALRTPARPPGNEGGGQCVGDVVFAQQGEIGSRKQRGVPQNQRSLGAIVPRIGPLLHSESQVRSGDRRGTPLHLRIIPVGNPAGCGCRVYEEPVLVAIVLLQRGVAVEMIRCEVGHRTDRGHQVMRVVQLEGRQFQRDPFGTVVVERHL